MAGLVVQLERRSSEKMPLAASGAFSGFVSIASNCSEAGEVRGPVAALLAELDGLGDPRVALDTLFFIGPWKSWRGSSVVRRGR